MGVLPLLEGKFFKLRDTILNLDPYTDTDPDLDQFQVSNFKRKNFEFPSQTPKSTQEIYPHIPVTFESHIPNPTPTSIAVICRKVQYMTVDSGQSLKVSAYEKLATWKP